MSSTREEELTDAGGWEVSALSHKLRRLDMEVKGARTAVRNLERTQNSLAVTEETENRLMARDASSPSLPLPVELLHLLSTKAGELYVVGKRHKELFDELSMLQQAEENAAQKALEAEQEYVTLIELVGGDGEHSPATAVVGMKQRDAFTNGLRELSDMYVERELLRNQLDAQTLELAKLVELEEASAGTIHQKLEAQAALNEKRLQFAEQQIELRRLESAVHRGDWMLARKTVTPSLEDRVRNAISERWCEGAQLDKYVENSHLNEAAMKSRATRMVAMEKRLEIYAETVSGGLENEEEVDVEVFNAVMKEIKALQALRTEAEYRTVRLDRSVEEMAYKTNAIQHITISTRQEREKIDHAHQRYMKMVQKDLEEKQTAHEEHMRALREEVHQLQRQQKQQPKRRSASAGVGARNGMANNGRRSGSVGVSRGGMRR